MQLGAEALALRASGFLGGSLGFGFSGLLRSSGCGLCYLGGRGLDGDPK